jgi:hypothetical protein
MDVEIGETVTLGWRDCGKNARAYTFSRIVNNGFTFDLPRNAKRNWQFVAAWRMFAPSIMAAPDWGFDESE